MLRTSNAHFYCGLYVADTLYRTVPDTEVSENSNSTCNDEEPECPLSEEETESVSGNVSTDSVGSQKSQQSSSAVAEDDMISSCSTSLSQDVSIGQLFH
jgi:hypothetical protein